MIKKIEVCEIKPENQVYDGWIRYSFKFTFKDSENYCESSYRVFKNCIAFDYTYEEYTQEGEITGAYAFTHEEKRQLEEKILNHNYHRLRHLLNPYRFM